MNYLSLFSGIEATSVAWRPLGWRALGFAEIDAFPSAVLAHHYPDVQNLGDVSKFKDWPDADVDVLVGGSPCQAFSVVGLRKGLDDARGNLTFTYLAVVARYRPGWVVWENVPGVLSIDSGRVFGAFLWKLAKLGYGWAYRVLDAQYFGLAQRRKRVFVVGSARGWSAAAAVLLERASLRGDPAPSKGAGEKTVAKALRSSNGGVYREDGHTIILQAVGAPTDGAHTTQPIGAGMRVRRLTPLECERLQGFPDNYTLIMYRGKPAPDSHRYSALGNSMAVPVMRWIGERIAFVNSIAAAA